MAELPRTLRAAQPALEVAQRVLPAAAPPGRRPAPGDRSPRSRRSTPACRSCARPRRLVAPSELRGLTADLRPLVPDLARLNKNLVPLYEQVRSASSCQNEVVLPWTHQTVPDANFPATGQVFQEGVSGLPGLAAESRSGDANGQWARVLAGNGGQRLRARRRRHAARPALRASRTSRSGVNPPKSPTGRRPATTCRARPRRRRTWPPLRARRPRRWPAASSHPSRRRSTRPTSSRAWRRTSTARASRGWPRSGTPRRTPSASSMTCSASSGTSRAGA